MATEQSGDPGRTPGSAEGDLETIEDDLEEKGLSQKDNSKSAPNSDQSSNSEDDNKNQAADDHDA